ncbi:hypothetical protein [Alloyangia pacifica]|uniref:hypothetical protein n=1 Tax=Alloyangia pacifica TaxID=311180 RepID=UPI001CFE18B1|nr:hypothetical protein [Alloyangia pacifica]
MRQTRRAMLLGGAALVSVAAVPVAMGGLEAFLRRVLAGHFGPQILEVAGVDDFVAEYAAQTGTGSFLKKAGAELYFAWHGDAVKMIPQAEALEQLFLQTILVRSNIIALYQGRSEDFEYTELDPWQPTCGLYLSALADETLWG